MKSHSPLTLDDSNDSNLRWLEELILLGGQPYKQLSVSRPKNDADIRLLEEELSDEWLASLYDDLDSDLDTKEDSDLDSDLDSPPVSSLSTADILRLHKERFSADFAYDKADREFNKAVAIELTQRNESPASRHYKKYDPVACKDRAVSDYMVDLQVFDLYWIWKKHPNHEVDTIALNGLLTGIFTGDTFDFNQAYKIAVGETTVKGKIKNLSMAKKLVHLRLPNYIQVELVLLRTDATRQRQNQEFAKKDRDAKKLDTIKLQALDIKHTLSKYCQQNPRARLNVEEYTTIWICTEYCKDSKTQIADTVNFYKKFTGKSIDKSNLRTKQKYLSKALSSRRV